MTNNTINRPAQNRRDRGEHTPPVGHHAFGNFSELDGLRKEIVAESRPTPTTQVPNRPHRGPKGPRQGPQQPRGNPGQGGGAFLIAKNSPGIRVSEASAVFHGDGYVTLGFAWTPRDDRRVSVGEFDPTRLRVNSGDRAGKLRVTRLSSGLVLWEACPVKGRESIPLQSEGPMLTPQSSRPSLEKLREFTGLDLCVSEPNRARSYWRLPLGEFHRMNRESDARFVEQAAAYAATPQELKAEAADPLAPVWREVLEELQAEYVGV